ncbi:MAG: type III PLP-dependent enzyme [Paracoccaceae bacterium]
MGPSNTIWANPSEYLKQHRPDAPVMFFSPKVLQETAARFLNGFPGMVTYAVKSNPDDIVIQNLAAAGLKGFDVASPAEMEQISRIAPKAAKHYNNPVRARSEIADAVRFDCVSYSVDSRSELDKLIAQVPAADTEITVRFKLPVGGAAYNFGAKFGATAELATELLGVVADAGFTPSLTFHPGTQCIDPAAWEHYIRAAAEISRDAGVPIARLNVGGGFPSHRVAGEDPDLEAIFDRIGAVTAEAFGTAAPALVCEPGRGLVAEAFTLATRVKAIRDGEHVFLNDGVYGALAEQVQIGVIDRTEVVSPAGTLRDGQRRSRIVFGPTCDSVDRLPGELMLPEDMEEEDYLLFHGFGAYSSATNTRFNGFGNLSTVTVLSLAG